MGRLIITILLISILSKPYHVLGHPGESTALVIETSQEIYHLNLPFVPGSLLVLITFSDPIRLIDYQSLIKRSSPPNFNPEDLQYVLDSKAGYATDSTVISVLPGKLKDAWISVLTRWDHDKENYLDRFDASMYFWFSKTSPESEVVVYNYCYPARGVAEVIKIMEPVSQCNPGYTNAFQALSVLSDGDCTWEYRGNLCEYTMKIMNLTERHMNFTTRKTGVMTTSFIYTALFLHHQNDIWSTVMVDDSKDFHIFYCKKLEFVGSYWTRWTNAFDPWTWAGTGLVTWMCWLLLGAKKYNMSVGSRITKMMQILLRQNLQNPTAQLILTAASFLVITSLYEGKMTSQIIAPLPLKVFHSLGEIFDDGYRLFFPAEKSVLPGLAFPNLITASSWPDNLIETIMSAFLRDGGTIGFSLNECFCGNLWGDIKQSLLSFLLLREMPGFTSTLNGIQV
ncbi:hypothetical protein Fcan01_26609 [Folsomia candida]|uniref:Uncharacterized protein n=1 Tax=Folsomia candida TaxID=158441 RepID=A0A226D0D8_FOLCA|nr:hypothetical protein Fcan01_26609 [Folsomia candida]